MSIGAATSPGPAEPALPVAAPRDGREARDGSGLPFISVVMPVRNEERFIEETLDQLLSQDYPRDRYEVIVVDGMSTDSTRERVAAAGRRHPGVRLVENPRRLSSSGRNIGFRSGRGDIFVVIDGHCYIEGDGLFRSIVKCFESSRAHCLGRPQPLDPPRISTLQTVIALARASRMGHSRRSYIYSQTEGYVSPVSVGAVYKREVFERIGYVDEEFDACEDVEFNYRLEKAGLTCYIHPSLRVRYYPRESLSGLFFQMARYGEGRLKLASKHREMVSLEMLVPAGLIVGPILLLFLSLALAPALPLLLALWGAYLLLVLGESLRIALRNRLSYLPFLPLALAAIHFGLGYGFLRGALKLGLRRILRFPLRA
jgi:succinoglycan biosynthesis protein ExoA